MHWALMRCVNVVYVLTSQRERERGRHAHEGRAWPVGESVLETRRKLARLLGAEQSNGVVRKAEDSQVEPPGK